MADTGVFGKIGPQLTSIHVFLIVSVEGSELFPPASEVRGVSRLQALFLYYLLILG